MNHKLLLTLLVLASGPLAALDYPGPPPGHSHGFVTNARVAIMNAAVRAEWVIEQERFTALTVENRQTGQSITMDRGHFPRIVLGDGRTIDLVTVRCEDRKPVSAGEMVSVVAAFRDLRSGISIRWSVTLGKNANAFIQSLELTASRDASIREIVFLDTTLDGARQVGQVDGSVVVCGDIFMAVEHPLARNTVQGTQVRCALPRGNILKAGQSWTATSVFGVVPPHQLRRGFLHYLEQRRAHPYRPFLHYNNWYNVWLARPVERTNEAECLETIENIGRELVRDRGVKLDAFVWDDGWDDHHSLWNFHQGFPNGFRKLKSAGDHYHASQGVWMSPWGGYAGAKTKRITFGKARGYETNAGGFSMAGPKYQAAFREVCLRMMREQGVTYFKFDGMGGGNVVDGASGGSANDIDAVLALAQSLRRENPEVYISATVGTWASPFWTLYADSIWRQGGDTGFHGRGDTRQQWITYRDRFCHERIVRMGPLYPLNSLMLHGPCIGDRRNPAKMVRNERSVADEIWSFFGSGTCLQELYVNPKLLTETMWDELAAAAKWSRKNRDILVDTHWIGGDPGLAETYGWASWQPRKGIMTLRNPSDQAQEFSITPQEAMELPAGVATPVTLHAIYPRDRRLPPDALPVDRPVTFRLAPFETITMELQPHLASDRP